MQSWGEIAAVVFDVDGVLTDGRLHYGPNGEELKVFHVRDGLGIKRLQAVGIKTAVLSGRKCQALSRRVAELGMHADMQGCSDKALGIVQLAEDLGCPLDRVLFVGDDLPDLPAIGLAGHSACPADAVPEVREAVGHVLASRGGQGVARELAEAVLAARASAEQGDS